MLALTKFHASASELTCPNSEEKASGARFQAREVQGMGAEEEGPGCFRASRTGAESGDQAGVVLHVDRKLAQHWNWTGSTGLQL